MRAGTKTSTRAVTKGVSVPLAVSRCAARPIRRAFTLIELLIAVAVLVIVILVTSQIFGTASQITGLGHASANVMQEAAVIEKHLRNDIARLSSEGLIAVRNVAVPNNIRGPGQPLLNPMLPVSATIRADQLVFFADGVAGMSTFGVDAGATGTAIQSQGTTSRIYYGHTFQMPQGRPFDWGFGGSNQGLANDPAHDVFPWHAGQIDTVWTFYSTIEQAGNQAIYRVDSDGPTINGTQPEARRWLFARQAVALVDDDNDQPWTNPKTSFLNNRTARSIFRPGGDAPVAHERFGWSYEVRNGRMDGAASRLDDIWYYIRHIASSSGNWMGSGNQPGHRDIISAQLLYYPRAERIAPSSHRVDQALTNHVIGSAVSSFIVEWTWEDGVGEVRDDEGDVVWNGFYVNNGSEFQPEQPWFGLNLPDRGVGFYGSAGYRDLAEYSFAQTILPVNIPNNVESHYFAGPDNNIEIYEAIFGYNRNRPVARNPFNNFVTEPYTALGYTPWPSAIRVTMVLHDPQGRLEHGREFQFVIDLPKRVR